MKYWHQKKNPLGDWGLSCKHDFASLECECRALPVHFCVTSTFNSTWHSGDTHICGMNEWATWHPAQQCSSGYSWDNLSRDFWLSICHGNQSRAFDTQSLVPGPAVGSLSRAGWQNLYFNKISKRFLLTLKFANDSLDQSNIISMTWEPVRTNRIGNSGSGVQQSYVLSTSRRFACSRTLENH